jgi:hypothetical protein
MRPRESVAYPTLDRLGLALGNDHAGLFSNDDDLSQRITSAGTATGEKVWRDRAFEQIDFAIKGQQPSGVFHTSYYFRKDGGATAPGYWSWDWGHNGYKVDINSWMVRYILQTWERVKQKEGVDRQDWHKAAIASLDWVLAQQNADGGFPQVVEIDSGKKSESVVCGRTLVGLPIIAKITGDERCLRASGEQEKFLRANIEGKFWYTGQHPDLPPGDFERRAEHQHGFRFVVGFTERAGDLIRIKLPARALRITQP